MTASKTPDFSGHGMASLISYYNEGAAELGRPAVARFSDRKTAESRCTKICEDLRVARAAAPGAKMPHPAIKSITSTDHRTTQIAADKSAATPKAAIPAAAEPKKDKMADKTTAEQFGPPKEGSRYARILNLLLEKRNTFTKVSDGAAAVYPGKTDMNGAFMMGFTGLKKKAEAAGLSCELRTLKEGKEVSVGLFEAGK